MSASDHLSQQFTPAIEHGQQLPMFMTPHEIAGMHSSEYGGRMEDVPKRMRDSYEHHAERDRRYGFEPAPSKLDRLSQQVKDAGGIESPVRVAHLASGVSSLYDGHHRAVTALEQNKLVPVDHYFNHHDIMHDINHANADVCYTCGKVPDAPSKRSWG